uniref:Protein kinase domain-containing protein n=1 Tax=Populus tomentosa TaxID=118781 RepID=A0A1L6K4G2_POPTO|nr:hypothetical protein [Populus tomentosa]
MYGLGMHLLWHRIIVLLFPIARGHILESWIDGVTRQIAVELDTYLNEFDPDGKHMGIGAISITNPVAARKLQIIVAYAGNPLMIFLNQSIDMSTWVLNSVCIGFTSTTGPFLESHESSKRTKMHTCIQLSKATRKFCREIVLGTGVFGSVYKGVVSSYPPMILAAKNISETSRQAYLAEICTRGHMRHKNIVQLQGWCHERQQLLLGIFEENSLLNYACSLQGRNALLEGVHRMLEGKHNEQQVKKALLVGLACLHPDTKGRPTIRKVEQILLKPNVPLMKVSESRPTAIFVPLYTAASTTRCEKKKCRRGQDAP